MSALDLNQILIFVKVVESGSFTKAAELLKQPKSRISRRLAALEKSLGAQLLYRTTRQMQLTETGKDYYRRCAPLIRDLEDTNNALSTHAEEISGVLRMTAPVDYGKFILAPVVNDFLRQHPKIRMEVILSDEYLDLVQESIDVAIRIGSLKDASMKSKKVSPITFILVASPAFLEKNVLLNKPEQLEGVPCLSFHFGDKCHWRLLKDKQSVKVKIETPVVAGSPEFICQLALLGRGVALLPEFLCEDALKAGKLVHVLKGWTAQPISVQLLTPAQKNLPARTKAFMDFASALL